MNFCRHFSRSFLLLFLIINSFFVSDSLRAQSTQDSTILWTAQWNHDGELLAAGGLDSDLLLFNGITNQLKHRYPVKGIQRVRWHPNQNLLAISTIDGCYLLDISKALKLQ